MLVNRKHIIFLNSRKKKWIKKKNKKRAKKKKKEKKKEKREKKSLSRKSHIINLRWQWYTRWIPTKQEFFGFTRKCKWNTQVCGFISVLRPLAQTRIGLEQHLWQFYFYYNLKYRFNLRKLHKLFWYHRLQWLIWQPHERTGIEKPNAPARGFDCITRSFVEGSPSTFSNELQRVFHSACNII